MARPDIERISAHNYGTAMEHAVSLFLADLMQPNGETWFGVQQIADLTGLMGTSVRVALNALVMDKEGPWVHRGMNNGRHVVSLTPEFHEGNTAPIATYERGWEARTPLPIPREEIPEEWRLKAARKQARQEEILLAKEQEKESWMARQRRQNPERAESRALRAAARTAFKEDWGRWPGKTETWQVEFWIENGQQWPSKEQISERKKVLEDERRAKVHTGPNERFPAIKPVEDAPPFESDWSGPPAEWSH
ncbi:hypothetical protein [Citricoccus nitrophenolicus]|uniref:hypothetical protein n=1 Tax=Citricoccus nitrophenolicus TaxID=863575 RepID=UPI0031E694A8